MGLQERVFTIMPVHLMSATVCFSHSLYVLCLMATPKGAEERYIRHIDRKSRTSKRANGTRLSDHAVPHAVDFLAVLPVGH